MRGGSGSGARRLNNHAVLRDEDEDVGPSGAVSFDPFADLLLGLIAILVPVISLLLASGASEPRSEDATVGIADAQPITRVVAAAAGLRIEVDRVRMPPYNIPLDRILTDEELAGRLRDVRNSGRALQLEIGADGLEAAFLFEVVAARHGPPTIRQRRLEQPVAGQLL